MNAAFEVCTPAPVAGHGLRPEPGTLDCVVARLARPPRDAMGHVLSMSGRRLVAESAWAIYGVPADGLVRDQHRRWHWPDRDLQASVTHCGALSAVVLAAGSPLGVDLQDVRERSWALAWLGELLGRPPGQPATIRDFAECEALIKGSHLTKETFAGVRLPPWRSGWRQLDGRSWVLSRTLRDGSQLAIVAEAPLAIRWWCAPADGSPPYEVPTATDLRQEVPS